MTPVAFQPNTPGLFRMPAEAYHSAPGVSKHTLDYIRECPRKCELYRKHGLDPTDDMIMGTMLHTALLEPDQFKDQFHIRPDTYVSVSKKGVEKVKKWNGNADACAEWMEAHADKPVLTSAELANVENIRKSCMDHPIAGPILKAEGEREVSVFAKCPITGLLRKGRPDLIALDDNEILWIVDLKFVSDGSDNAFRRQAEDLRYFVQAAYYIDLLELLGFPGVRFMFISVGKKPMHPKEPQHWVCPFEIPPADIENARGHYIRDLMRFKQCLETGIWPDDTNRIHSLEMSSWYRRENAI